MPRVHNFSAGPAMLPTEVLEASARALLDYQGKGFGIAGLITGIIGLIPTLLILVGLIFGAAAVGVGAMAR